MELRIGSVVAGPVREGGQETGLTLTLPSHTLAPGTLQTDTGMWGSGDNADPHRYIVSILCILYILSTADHGDHADPPLASVGQQWAAGAW